MPGRSTRKASISGPQNSQACGSVSPGKFLRLFGREVPRQKVWWGRGRCGGELAQVWPKIGNQMHFPIAGREAPRAPPPSAGNGPPGQQRVNPSGLPKTWEWAPD